MADDLKYLVGMAELLRQLDELDSRLTTVELLVKALIKQAADMEVKIVELEKRLMTGE